MPDKQSLSLTVEPADGIDARWCLQQYFAELALRFEGGFDPFAGGGAVEKKQETFLIARLAGRPVGCGILRPLGGAGVGEIKRMWVSPDSRGMGLAGRLLSRLEELARQAGYTRLRLDTNRALTEARAMYVRAGYAAIPRYNDNPYADFWFEKVL